MTGFVEAARREKLKELIERGIAPFAYRFDRSATANAALAAYRGEDDETRHSLAGRLVALRPHGKTTFAHLESSRCANVVFPCGRNATSRPASECLVSSSSPRYAASAAFAVALRSKRYANGAMPRSMSSFSFSRRAASTNPVITRPCSRSASETPR